MQRTKIRDVLGMKPTDKVTVMGWVRTRRDQKTFSFIELNDGSTIKNVQIIADGKLKNYDKITKMTNGASCRVTGKLVKSPGAEQGIEIQAKEVEIFGYADPLEYPMQKKGIALEKLREFGHLRVRGNLFGAVFRVRSALAQAIHKFFSEKGFVYVNTPIITGSDCEGAGQMFRVTTLDLDKVPKKNGKADFSKDFFGKNAYLTVSGQLEGELFATALGEIYTFGPTFRAEWSNTPRHISEFWMIEPEMAFYDIKDNMDLAEEFVKYLINYVLKNCKEDMEFFDKWVEKGLIGRLKKVADSKFKRITYTEAVNILLKSGKKFEFKVEWGNDLQAEHERYLTEQHFKCPVIVTDYPKQIKAFYMKRNKDGKTVRAMDVLVPSIGEIIGGSEREVDYEKLRRAIIDFELNKDDYWWYLDTRRFGTVPHSGFGLGFERFIMFVTGMKNIRDVIPFARYPKSCEF
ncbi:asparagine--tRNA ligase [Candidatus Woesearchaeota archaeon]|nr:asparagine--tRNA ligase [Candidatus Woesearchaeota archaeon]